MRVGIYPGSFDPMTKGHLDLIERAAKLVDHLIIAVLVNPNKTKGLLSIPDRVAVLEEATAHLSNVEVDNFTGLLVDYARLKEADVIIRGLRTIADFEMEQNMAQINKQLNSNLETIFLITAPQYAYISSSSVRELVYFKGEYEWMIPEAAFKRIKNIQVEG
ncbi:MAG: pantetheine-phosphate adenylyltransferase [Cellulosilyticum sp.]|nr:pantetheine-phosphate adenylyltransferase [Cellulosilyticum sp.]